MVAAREVACDRLTGAVAQQQAAIVTVEGVAKRESTQTLVVQPVKTSESIARSRRTRSTPSRRARRT